MSINHFSSTSEPNFLQPSSLWCPTQHQHLIKNFMEEDQASNVSSAREHLFEKPLTPSDVGKLNRLVIPKQHAERYFPLGGEAGGLVLGFEDESGKSWKFRYSYWNSSQSYVLTKGWSRYVKEKQLDAGDVVLFQRIRERLFIGWRRRGDSNNCTGFSGSTRGVSCSSSIASNNNIIKDVISMQFQTDEFPRPATSIGNPRRLRLFGVNLECQVDEQSSEPSTPDDSSMPSQGLTHHHHHHHQHQFYNSQPAYSYSSNSPSHMVRHVMWGRDILGVFPRKAYPTNSQCNAHVQIALVNKF